MTKPQIERRAFPIEGLEVRADGDDGKGKRIKGHAAVFNRKTDVGGMFMEVIKPGAFTKTLKEHDQVMLWNHNDDMVLGRRSAGTLELSEDKKGLAVDGDLPDTSAGRDAHVLIERGDVKGMSFGFSVIKELWDESKKPTLREVLEVRLFEVSPTAFPAYPTTDVQARAIMEARGVSFDTTPEPGQAAHSEAGAWRNDLLRRRLQLAEAE